MRIVGRLSPSTRRMIVLTAIAIVVAAAFLAAMLTYTRGHLAPPLDDTFIYFQYARNLAHGHWFEYNVGDGFSSGATSVLYTLLLAFGYRLGATGMGLMIYGGIFAIGTLTATAWLVADLVKRETSDSDAALLGAGLVLLNGWLLWSYFSLMEVGLESMLIMLTLWFLLREKDRPAAPGFAVSASLLALSRPEATLVTLVFTGIYVLNVLSRPRRGGGRLPPTGVLASAAGSLTGILTYLLINYMGAGTLATNTFKAKVLLGLPYDSFVDKLGAVADNFLRSYPEALGLLAPPPIAASLFILFTLGLATMAGRELWQRPMGLGIASFGGFLALQVGLSVNVWPLGQHARYVVPAMPLAAVAIAVGLWSILHRLAVPRRVVVTASAVLLGVLVVGLPGWVRNYGMSSADIYFQQMQSGYWVRDTSPPEAVIGLNDAGALAYLGERRVVDLVGLVTNGMVDSSNEGVASTYEALERLEPGGRPTLFVIYPEWFASLASQQLGLLTKVAEFPLERLTASGGDSAVAFKPDYSAMGDADRPVESHKEWAVVDSLDVADIESEDAHAYHVEGREPGARPQQLLMRAKDMVEVAVRMTDGGREVSGFEEFRLRAVPRKPSLLVLRTTATSAGTLRFEVNGRDLGIVRVARSGGSFREIEVAVPADLIDSDEVKFRVEPERPDTYKYGSFYYWLMQAPE